MKKDFNDDGFDIFDELEFDEVTYEEDGISQEQPSVRADEVRHGNRTERAGNTYDTHYDKGTKETAEKTAGSKAAGTKSMSQQPAKSRNAKRTVHEPVKGQAKAKKLSHESAKEPVKAKRASSAPAKEPVKAKKTTSGPAKQPVKAKKTSSVPADSVKSKGGSREPVKASKEKMPRASVKENRKRKTSKKEDNFLLSMLKGMPAMMADMSMADKIVASTGVIVLVVAILTCSVYVSARAVDDQVEAFAQLGEQLGAVSVSGESGLIAVTDAHAAGMNSQIMEETEETQETEENDAENEVLLNMTSVEKDLKIKFMNRATGKLISGVAFEVKVTGPDKNTSNYKDDDKDGIIYKTDMKPGSYEVSLVEIPGLSEFKFSTSPVSVKVKDKIEYKQIDVADEVKTEAEVNVAAEDTAIQEAETAPALKDTVEWVESTKTPIGGSDSEGEYERVDKSDIPDPSSSSRVRGRFLAMDTISGNDGEGDGNGGNEGGGNGGNEGGGSGNEDGGSGGNEGGGSTEPEKPVASVSKVSISGASNIDIGKTVSLSAKVEGSNLSDSDKEVSWSSSDSSIATVSGSGVVTGVKAGTVTITAVSKKDSSKSASCSITVNKAAVTITLNQSELSLKAGDSASLTATVSSGGVSWKSGDEKIAKVDNGKVTAVAAGTTTITATSSEDTGKTASCKVTVTAAGALSVTLDTTSATVYTEDKKEIKASQSNGSKAVTYSFSSDNTSVASVSGSNEKATVTGVKEGTATITVTAKDANGASATATCKVTVKKNPKKDTSSKLKDKDGNQLYIKNSKGEFVEATYADYYKADKFYKKTANVKYKYTGWQTIDGKTYFFDKNGNPVKGEQIIQGAKYVFDSDGAIVNNSSSGIMGIDVSKWNGTIDWTAVKNSGVSYVIIRCGYRGSSTGALIQDPKFKANIQGAAAAGIKVGVYFFTQAMNEVEAVEEASMVLNLIKGYKISYPVFLDVESSGGRADRLDRNTRTAAVNAFCKTIQNGGYKAGVYANKTWFESKMNAASLSGYKIWLAQYAAKPTYKATRYDMWQYTSKGKVSGIKGDVDMNISYLGY